MNASLMLRKCVLAAAALVAAFGLSACGAGMDDLDRYINEVKARPGGRIEPLPEITPYEVFTYIADAEGKRSPFMPDTPQSAGPTGPRRNQLWSRANVRRPDSPRRAR